MVNCECEKMSLMVKHVAWLCCNLQKSRSCSNRVIHTKPFFFVQIKSIGVVCEDCKQGIWKYVVHEMLILIHPALFKFLNFPCDIQKTQMTSASFLPEPIKNFELWLCRDTLTKQRRGSERLRRRQTDSSTPRPVLPEGFSQVQFLALGSGTENENLQIRSQGFMSEPDPGFSPRVEPDLRTHELNYGLAFPLVSAFLLFVLLFVLLCDFFYFYLSSASLFVQTVLFFALYLMLIVHKAHKWYIH